MESFQCIICSERYEDPVECLNCNNNICKKHAIIIENGCPICRCIPFKFRDNVWLKRTILSLDSLFTCIFCEYEGDEKSFWSHLIENHKKQIITKCNKSNQIQENNQKQNLNKDSKNQSKNENINEVLSVNAPQNFFSGFNSLNNNFNNNNYNNQNPNISQNNIYNNNNNDNSNYNNYNNNDINNDNDDNNNNNINNNIIFNKIKTHRIYPSVAPKEFTKKHPISGRNQILYCGKKNEFINCDCCPDHMCKTGNCICVICMVKNYKRLNLQKGQLINRCGKIANLYKGSYYCGSKYESIIENVLGMQFKKHLECKYPLEPCNDCKVLTKFQIIYNKNIK